MAPFFRLIAYVLLPVFFLYGEDCPHLLNTPDEIRILGELRVRAIRGWDKLVTWALSPKIIPYPLETPLREKKFKVEGDLFSTFTTNYGYFSTYHPMIGIVTKGERDIHVTQCLLTSLREELKDPEQTAFSAQEILTKIIAYRTLKKGMKITLPLFGNEEVTYLVDEVIDLWHGMPGFGLVSEKKGIAPPILLFRGTDLNLTTEKGWASVLSDLDTTGPGFITFLRAQKEIHKWLQKMANQGTPPITAGFSLGGVLTLYTILYESELLNKEYPSIAFNPPGISIAELKKWEDWDQKKIPPYMIYVNDRDFISQIGFFPSNVWVASADYAMEVIEAHVTLISSGPFFTLQKVDVVKMNGARK